MAQSVLSLRQFGKSSTEKVHLYMIHPLQSSGFLLLVTVAKTDRNPQKPCTFSYTSNRKKLRNLCK